MKVKKSKSSKRFSLKNQFFVLSTLALIVSVGWVVNLAQQRQEQRSRAAAPSKSTSITLGSLVNVVNPAIGGFSAVWKDKANTLWLGYQTTIDSSSVPSKFSVKYKKAGATSWTSSSQSLNFGTAVNAANGDGIIISPERANQVNNRQASISIYTKKSSAVTWTKRTGTINLTNTLRGGANVYFNNGIFQVNGTFYAPYYAAFTADGTGSRVEFATSSDGITWKTQGTIFKPYNTAKGRTTFTETSVVHLGNGVMYAVGRRSLVEGTYMPLAYAVSTNYGKTWASPRDAKMGTTPLSYTAQPRMVPLGNDVFALVTGRPDNYLITGVKNGNDIAWQTKKAFYSNYYTLNRYAGSSGYIGVVVTGSGSNFADLLLSFDSCAPGWGCNQKPGGTYTSTKIPRIYTRTATIRW